MLRTTPPDFRVGGKKNMVANQILSRGRYYCHHNLSSRSNGVSNILEVPSRHGVFKLRTKCLPSGAIFKRSIDSGGRPMYRIVRSNPLRSMASMALEA